jgi:hypothetical protein
VTDTLGPGVHQVFVRAQDSLGRWSVAEPAVLSVGTMNSVDQSITDVEYWFDDLAHTLVDVQDTSLVNWADVISTTGLENGVHYFSMRARDNLGRLSASYRVPLFVLTLNAQLRAIVGAEFWVNEDPGPGNGIPIHLPQDGSWDEGEENQDTVITGLPVGLHLVGFRARDDLGNWSMSLFDTLAVGPLVVVHTSAGTIKLDWQSGPGVVQFYIFRNATPTGIFSLLDSTSAQSYTVGGISGAPLKQFYYVTFRSDTISSYRMSTAGTKQAHNQDR